MGIKAATGKDAGTDTWLTPRALLEALGAFTLDPCCPAAMPWRTASQMWTNEHEAPSPANKWLPMIVTPCLVSSGLDLPWRGRVWCNPPYSAPLPWIEKMASHRDGAVLVSARGTETRWGQALLSTADGVFFFARRLVFHYVDGTPADTTWQPSMLGVYGGRTLAIATRLPSHGYNGVLMMRKALQ